MASENDFQRFCANVKVRRLKLGISQEELARRIGCHRGYILRIECGDAKPGFILLNKLIRAFGCSYEELLGGE